MADIKSDVGQPVSCCHFDACLRSDLFRERKYGFVQLVATQKWKVNADVLDQE